MNIQKLPQMSESLKRHIHRTSVWTVFLISVHSECCFQLYSFRADYSKKESLQNKTKLIKFLNYCYIRVFKTLRNPAIFILFLIIPVFELLGNISSPTFTCFYPKRLTVHSGYICFVSVCSLGIEPTTFCAANAMLYHWATGTCPAFWYKTKYVIITRKG